MRRIIERKQTLSGLLTVGCLLLLVCLLTAGAAAADTVASGYCGGEGDGTNLTWTLDSEGTLTISGTGAMKDYSSYKDQPWYSYKSSLKALVIENGVTTIGDEAFDGCTGFAGELVIPDSVTSIGDGAFYYCPGFTGSLVIPDSVTGIGNRAFRFCSGFTGSLTIPDSVTSIGGSAFADCEGFRGDLLIPDSVTTIANGTFMGCSFRGSLVIPDSVISIDQHAFYECGITGDLIIPNSVTSIGMYAFYGCTGLTGSLVIPDSVESIGNFAFCGCTHFDGSLTIGNNVTSIGFNAFQNCYGFTGSLTIGDSVTIIDYKTFQNCSGFTGDLVIPDSVTKIDDYAFFGCSGFTGDLVIPDSVTSIGNSAFYGCSGFTGSLTIGSGVTSIGQEAFRGCSGFTGDLVIPDSVTSIGKYAFYLCSGLSGKVYFSGNAPTVYAASSNRSFATGSVLYYIPNTSGWTNSDAYDADAGTWNGYTLKTWDGPRKVLTTVAEQTPAGQYGILVVDSTGLSIQGAKVTVNGVSVITGETGLALFDALTAGPPHITVTCDGYRDWSNVDSDYMQNANGYDIVILYPDMIVNMHLAFAYYRTATEDIVEMPALDLLSWTQRLSLTSKNGTFTLSCAAVDAEQAVGYALYQGDRMIRYVAASSGDETTGGGLGLFSDVSIQSFSAGGDVFVRAYGANGYTVDTRINLSFVDDARKEYKNSIKLGGNKLTFTTNQDFPFVGGSTLTFDIPDLPFDIVVSEDTVHFGINFNLKTDDEKSFADKREEITEVMNQLKDMKGIQVNKNLQKQLDAFTTIQDMNVPVAGKVKANFVGYGEGKLDEDGLAAVNTELYILVQTSVTFQGPTYVVGVVPVTFSVKVGIDGKLAATISCDMRTSTPDGDIKFTLTSKLEAFGGVGVGKLIGAGAYGSAEMPIEIQLIGTSQTPGVNSIDLTGSLGLKAYVSIFEYKKDFAYRTWHIYTRTARTASTYALQSESWLAGLYDDDAYAAADLSYLSGESGWLGSGISLAGLDGETTGTSQLTALQTGTYRNMQPVLGSADGTPVLVWVRANTARGDYDYPQLMYSCFTGGSWTEPQPVDGSNVTADAAPALATAPDGTLYLAYQSSAQPMQEGDDLAAYAASQTIVTARFDAEAGTFTDFATVSGSGVFSRSPVITAAGGTLLVAWVSNSDSSDYFMQNSTGSICYAQLVGDKWVTGVLAENCSTVTDLTAGLLNGQPTVAAVLDGDADLTTTGDSILMCYPLAGDATQVASGDFGGIALAQLPDSGASALLWFSDAALCSYDGTATATVFETGAKPSDFTALSDRILFNAASGEEDSNLYAFVYSDGAWSDAVQVTAQESYLQSYAAAEIGGATYLAAVQADVTIGEGTVEEDCTLAWGVLGGITDLAVYALSVDHSQETPGGALPVSVDIQNLGDTAVSSFTVTITDPSGATVGEQRFTAPIAPAAVETVELTMTLGETVSTADYTVTVTASGDGNTDNDTATLSVGRSDLAVSASLVQVGDSSRIYLRVVNNGAVAAGGQLTVTCGEKTLQVVQLGQLAQGESSLYAVAITREELGGLTGIVRAELTTDSADSDSFNDAAEVFVALPYTQSVSISGVSGNTLTVDVRNRTAAVLYAALYDDSGRMLSVVQRELTQADVGEVALTLEAPALADAAQAKVFLLDSSGSPLLPCVQTESLRQ